MAQTDRERVSALITGCWSTQAIHAAVKLGVFDALATEPLSSTDIASRLGTHRRSTFRLLRALANLDLVTHVGADRFAITDAGRLLVSDAPESLSVIARHWGGRTWASLGQLQESVRTGDPYKDSGKEGFFSMKDKPELAAVFNASMASQTLQVAEAIVAAYDFSEAREIVDLGGGYGALLAVALKKHPHLKGASADLAYMERAALEYLTKAGVGDRARYVPTDFFESVVAGADVYLLKFIIHDWEDAESIAILTNAAKAAGSKGKVLVIERMAPERASADPAQTAVLRGDLQMLASTGGVERTAAEYDALFAASGLKRSRTIPTSSPFSLIEAVAA
jgi:hypothetical protein